MSTLPQPDLSGTEAEAMAALAQELGQSSAWQFLQACGRGLSAQELAYIPEANLRPRARKPLVAEVDAMISFGNMKAAVTLNVYGEFVPHFAGSRETPDERGGFVVDDITVCGGPRCEEESIYFAMSEGFIEEVTEYAEDQL